MRRAEQKTPKRVARSVHFDMDVLNYYSHMARLRNEEFPETIGSSLREVMRDDLAAEGSSGAETIN